MAGNQSQERRARVVVQTGMAAFALLVGSGLDAVVTWWAWSNWGPVPAVALCLFFWPIPAILTYWLGFGLFGRVVLATGVFRAAAGSRPARVVHLGRPIALTAIAALSALAVVGVGLTIVVLEMTGEDGGQQDAVLVQDAEAVALQIGDMPMEFIEVEGSAMHVTNDQSCAGAEGAELNECLSQLEEWGRTDGYQVEYASSDSAALLSGTYDIFGAVSLYQDQEGAVAAFRAGKERLQKELEELEDANLVEIPTVGDESVAFVTTATQEAGTGGVPVSLYVVDFRRGNVLGRTGATAPTALASVDDALRLAQVMDSRILRVASLVSPTASTTAVP
ncbi:MAG: hypothetical protein MUP14_04775 [Dehalococcoidia bacterium]|nr:hypothetical protein [Dehalococcoidia bacterium]